MSSSHIIDHTTAPRTGVLCCLLVALIALTSAAAMADDPPTDPEPSQFVEVSAPVTPFIYEGDLRLLPKPVEWKAGDPIKEIPRRFYPKPGTHREPVYETGRDPLLDLQMTAESGTGGGFNVPSRTFAGQTYTGVNPPDTVGDVGLDYYVQIINSGSGAKVAIYDKALPVPNLISSFNLDSLGSGNCASGSGDGIVLYDRLAGRWMLSEFAGGNSLCVYISQTANPVNGGWYNYRFGAPSFPDYPKYGVWPTDANGGLGSYVVTANDGGPGIYALDRGGMLTGSAAAFQRMTIPDLPGFGFEAPTPADIDGPNPPPSTTPAIIMRHRDTENHGGPAAPGDLLEMWYFNVDWINPGNTVLSQNLSIDVAEFDSNLCGLTSFFCFPQPGTGTTLDPLREVIMNRLQYINHGDYATLVGNFVTDVDGTDHGGLRWFELRSPGASWSLHQEGTYSIDADHRWMAASAMDQSGNIALAYNISSTTTHPSLRYTGRLASDPLNQMTQAEGVIHTGTSHNGSNRYGDYSAMNVDPEDDCTFWFTGMDNTSTAWRTQIASFTFDACGCELYPDPLEISVFVAGDNQLDIEWNDATLETVIEYYVLRSRTAGGPYAVIATIPDSSLGVAGGSGYMYSDTTVSGGIDYFYTVVASDGEACKSDSSNEASATATGSCTLAPVFDGLDAIATPSLLICTLDLSWNPATADCGGPITYNVYRSGTQGFTPGPGTLLISGITSTAASDLNTLVSGNDYYYVVRAVDVANGVEEMNTVELSATPQSSGPDGCTTGSSCPENPFVDVDPEGPQTLCQDSPPVLTANLTQGEGPYVYQWTRDGVPIPGQVAETFIPTALGDFAYNCDVRSLSCPDFVFDGVNTDITLQNQPVFGGIASATDSQFNTCSVEVSWNAASTVCAGPITYAIYRGTDPGVTATPENLIATGVTGSSYSDAGGLLNGEPYYYIVRALDGSQRNFDNNSVVASATPNGPNSGLYFFLNEDFSSAAEFTDWTVTTGPGPHRCGEWSLTSGSTQRPSGGSGSYAYANSSCGVLLPQTSTILTSADLDFNVQGIISDARLEYDIYFNHHNGGDDATVEVWDGSQWVVLWADTNSDYNTRASFDIMPYAIGNSEFKVRFNYQGGNNDFWFSVDNVTVSANIENPCSTTSGPVPVPDGSGSTGPLLADRLTTSGDTIGVTWDTTSCTAPVYNLLYGDLARVDTTEINGSACGLGGSGSFTWANVPSGNLFYLILATDGAGTESSWGYDSEVGERNGPFASGECSTNDKDLSATCP